MAIKNINFRNCEVCGVRFRADATVARRFLCKACAEAEETAKSKPRVEPQGEHEEENWSLERSEPQRPTASPAVPPESAPAVTSSVRAKRMEAVGRANTGPTRLQVTISRWAWGLVFSAGILGLVLLVAAAIWNLRQSRARTVTSSRQLRTEPWDRPVPPNDPLLTVLPDFEESIKVASNFLEARDTQSILPWVRGGESMRAFVEAQGPEALPKPWERDSMRELTPMVEGSMAYQCFGTEGGQRKFRMVAVVPTKDGPRVDFKAYREWSDVPFADLITGKAKRAEEVRVMLWPSTYYNFEFADQERYVAFDAFLTSGSAAPVTLYALRGSEIADRISWVVERMGLHPATVALEARGRSEGQYLITRLLALGFVVPDDPG